MSACFGDFDQWFILPHIGVKFSRLSFQILLKYFVLAECFEASECILV